MFWNNAKKITFSKVKDELHKLHIEYQIHIQSSGDKFGTILIVVNSQFCNNQNDIKNALWSLIDSKYLSKK